MPNAADTDGILRQNLADAGCGPAIIRQCMTLVQEQDQSELMRVLSRHRQTLLDTVHQSEKWIDCLDYLVYTLEKQNKSQSHSGGI